MALNRGGLSRRKRQSVTLRRGIKPALRPKKQPNFLSSKKCEQIHRFIFKLGLGYPEVKRTLAGFSQRQISALERDIISVFVDSTQKPSHRVNSLKILNLINVDSRRKTTTALDAISHVLRNPENAPHLRSTCAVNIGFYKKKKSERVLLEVMRSERQRIQRGEDAEVYANCLAGLGLLGKTQHTPLLISELTNNLPIVRWCSAKGLGLLGDKNAIVPLRDLVRVERTALEASNRLTGTEASEKRNFSKSLVLEADTSLALLGDFQPLLELVDGAEKDLSKIWEKSHRDMRSEEYRYKVESRLAVRNALKSLIKKGNPKVFSVVVEACKKTKSEMAKAVAIDAIYEEAPGSMVASCIEGIFSEFAEWHTMSMTARTSGDVAAGFFLRLPSGKQIELINRLDGLTQDKEALAQDLRSLRKRLSKLE